MDAPTQELVKCMAKLVIKREQELMRLRPDLGFVIFADTSDLGCLKMLRSVAESWQEKYEQGTVKHSPQNGPRHVAPEALQGEDGGGAGQRPAAPEVPGGRLAGANGECTEPELGISYLGLGEKVPDCGPGPSTEARGVPPQDRHAHREPAEGGSLDQVLNAEGAAGELRDGGDPFQLDVEFAGNLERSVLPSTPGPERMCGDEDGRAQNATRAHQQAPSCEGGRGRVYGNAAVRLEKSQLARQSVEARVGLERPPVEAARRDAQLLLHESLHLPAVQPVNSSNLCYINSVMQAANWLGAITSAPALCFGRLQAGFRIFGARRRVRLIDVYAFRPLSFRGQTYTDSMMQVSSWVLC